MKTAAFPTIPMRSNLASDQVETTDMLVRQVNQFKDKHPVAVKMDPPRLQTVTSRGCPGFGTCRREWPEGTAEGCLSLAECVWSPTSRPSASKNGIARASQPEQPARPLFITGRIPLSQTNVISEPREGH